MAEFLVGTIHVQGDQARWRRRRTLIVEQMMAVLPDVCLLQGLRPLPNQAAWFERQLKDRLRVTDSDPYQLVRFGKVAVLSRLPIIAKDSLDLGSGAVAVRVNAVVSSGESVDFVSVMLTADPMEISLRRQQVLALVGGWTQGHGNELSVEAFLESLMMSRFLILPSTDICLRTLT